MSTGWLARPVLFCLLCLAIAGRPGNAQQAPLGESVLEHAALDARLRFLEDRLERPRAYAEVWQYGWSAVQGAAIIWRLPFLNSDDKDTQLRGMVDVVKATFGLADLWVGQPIPAFRGADPIRAMPGRTRAEKIAKIERGEAILRDSARRATDRATFWDHRRILGFNLLGGAVLLVFGDEQDALMSTLIGIAGGELQMWTEPARAVRDLREYEGRFGPQQRGWSLGVGPAGVRATLRF